ncbi:hypothetical protein jhhlp_003302 [Lomentospora prolificans]|uniref:Uncharacterized protein n=1 Tax=Lomentospora prolificans TaxID=41688 RepID=A0A2N3NGK7_9PEZI|nr:hypothetical protein jhhlp_003302 [Lomentospora prolificans]
MDSPHRRRLSPTDGDRPKLGSTTSVSRSPRPHREDYTRAHPSRDGESHRNRSRERTSRQGSHRVERPDPNERIDSGRSKRKRSPRGDRDEDRASERRRRKQRETREVQLPLGARALVKGDFEAFRPLLAYYLAIQKQKDARTMDERELRGRWKSFLGKWNAGELAEGWYDPGIWETARAAEREEFEPLEDTRRDGRSRRADEQRVREESLEPRRTNDGSDSDSDIGPALPPSYRSEMRHTAATPHLEDLKLRDELVAEDAAQDRSDRIAAIRHARKLDRRDQKERLEELVPRADPGSRERQLEKKRETNEKMREFREKSPGAGEVDEGTLMGGGDDSLEAAKREKEVKEKKKSEREARREEIWRAKMAEREERVREYKEREEGTIEMLKELARSSGRSAI